MRTGLGVKLAPTFEGGVEIRNLVQVTEDLSEEQFMQQIGRIIRAILVVQMLVRRHVRLASATPIEPLVDVESVPQLPQPSETA